jgi:hypothetical protein
MSVRTACGVAIGDENRIEIRAITGDYRKVSLISASGPLADGPATDHLGR